MKKLIFTLLVLSPPLFAASVQEVKEEILTDQELSKKLVSTVKDIQVEQRLESSSELKECLKDTKFDPKDKPAARERKAKEAEDCFIKKLSKQDKNTLQKLSDSLGLQSYGLVTTKEDKAITDYLANKIYKSLTGIDRNAQQEKVKFENRKLIDQKDFIELYYNHVAKSTMYEISRFCFENFRLITPQSSEDSFAEHWGSKLNGFSLSEVTDDGQGGFGVSIQTDVTDKEKSYEAMFKGIAKQNTDPDAMGKFYLECAKMIVPLCNEFKKSVGSNTTAGTPPTVQRGSNACLAQGRLQEGRVAIQKAKLLKDSFEKDLTGGKTVALDHGKQPTFFQANAENRYDSIVSVTSYDMLEGGKVKDDLLEDCSKSPEDPKCKDAFLVVDDSKAKAQHGLELHMLAKKQIEIAKIREMDKKSLPEYLEANGYLELKKKFDKGELSQDDISKEVGQSFDAQKEALIASMNQKLGNRQMSEDELKGKDEKQVVEENVKDKERERTRMAQVVLFNNIVTAYLPATDKKTGKQTRYGSSWKTEQKMLEGEAKIDEGYFNNYKEGFKDDQGSSATGIEDFSFLDGFLEG